MKIIFFAIFDINTQLHTKVHQKKLVFVVKKKNNFWVLCIFFKMVLMNFVENEVIYYLSTQKKKNAERMRDTFCGT